MSPSSLIFVAVIAIWVAYLVVDTTRRREHLLTARTVDRFSAHMRVLQRRAVSRESAEAFEASTAPMRGSSSMLLHPRQGAATMLSHAATSLTATDAARVDHDVATVEEPSKRAAEGSTAVPSDRRGLREIRRGATALRRRLPTLATLSSTGIPRASMPVSSRLSRRRIVRVAPAVALLGCVLSVPLTGVLAIVDQLTWWWPAACLVLSVLTVATLRRRALRRRERRPESASMRHVAPAAAPVVRDLEEDDTLARPKDAEPRAARVRPSAAPMPVAQEYVPFDQDIDQHSPVGAPVVAEQAEPKPALAATATSEDPLLGEPGWDPVPVPPPTYTLKARATRPLPPPIEMDEGPVPIEDDWDDVPWEAPFGRAAGE